MRLSGLTLSGHWMTVMMREGGVDSSLEKDSANLESSMVAYVSLMRNGLTESQLVEARQELKNMYAQDGNVFTGLILYWREVRGKSHGEDLLCGDKNVQEKGPRFLD